MENGKADYWAFIEKIHDLTEYVQELLRQNGRLKRRVEELEQAQESRDEQIASLRHRLRRGDPPAPGSEGGNGAHAETSVWRPGLQLTHPGVRTC